MTETGFKRLAGLIFFSIIFFTGALAQVSQPMNISTNHEKIYIHFDRPFYNAGETIWFKAYLYNKRLPSMLSDELYLQLRDKAGKIVEQKKYLISGATVSGDIKLGDSLQGYYSLVATTKAISFNSENFVYSKSIYIYSPVETIKNDTPDTKLTLRFFPESGHLVDRIRTQVAFQASDISGNPLDITGVIKSDSVTVIAPFSSLHNGIGRFSFTPHINDSLFAEVEFKDHRYTFTLPKIEGSGVNIKITDGDSAKIFDITRSKTDKSLFDSVRLIVSMDNDTVFENTMNFGNEQKLSGILKTNSIPSGILRFMILNNAGIPIAERLCFVNNKEYLIEPELVVVKRDTAKRMKNNFELIFPDTIQRSFSISVTDAGLQDFPDKENIISRLLLTSDLRGTVYDSWYYFSNDNEETKLALDNVMLTHGWTRYNWKKEPQVNNPGRGKTNFLLGISGIVNDANTGIPVSEGMLALSLITDSSFQVINVPVNKSGQFHIDSLIFFGTAKIIYSYTNSNNKRIMVNLKIDADETADIFNLQQEGKLLTGKNNNDYSEGIKRMPVNFSPVLDSKFKQLSTVFLKTKIKRPEDRMNEKYASPLFRSTGKIILDNISRPYNNRSLSVVNYILDNIRTLAYDGEANSLVNRKNVSMQTKKYWIVSLLLNENQTPLDVARTITMDRVALIKFYEAGFVGVGTSAPGGAVAVYLKNNDDDRNPVDGPNSFSYKGYSITKEFYNPDYSTPPKESTVADNRLTLYWNSSYSGTGQSVKFGFYNNDLSKKLNIIIEGFDGKGKLLHYEKTL